MKTTWILGLLLIGILATHSTYAETRVTRTTIDTVPAGFPVGFCLLTQGNQQYAAYYNADRQMTVASRDLSSNKWTYTKLPSKIAWDSHNYITMALDRDGRLHLSGNMHNVKLIYFRTEKPGDIRTLKRLPMTGENEERATYPKFLTDHEGNLIFNYRNGGSGNGMRIYNKYDLKARTWSRLLDTPLLDGEGKRNAYPLGPLRGPDGIFHLVWVWRDTPDCATNHHLSYARSKDLIRWETAFAEKVELPMRLGNESLCIDPIPSGGGIINGGEKLTFDKDNRPIITYHKNDDQGNMQVYAMRFTDGKWIRSQLSDWNKPVHFSGNGSMGDIGIRITGLTAAAPGILSMTYRHRDYGSGRLVVDEKTLLPLAKTIPVAQNLPRELNKIQSDFKGMGIKRAADKGDSDSKGVRYLLQWETLGPNRDRPRQGILPEPSRLELIELREDATNAKRVN